MRCANVTKTYGTAAPRCRRCAASISTCAGRADDAGRAFRLRKDDTHLRDRRRPQPGRRRVLRLRARLQRECQSDDTTRFRGEEHRLRLSSVQPDSRADRRGKRGGPADHQRRQTPRRGCSARAEMLRKVGLDDRMMHRSRRIFPAASNSASRSRARSCTTRG